ncbi:MAG: nucleotide exchange factor GrpE, partial [Candidatus Dadabacteria bacterium]|nr:nucleotide exchange factor GrpE [Candidatus Dadabacteria bacterium]
MSENTAADIEENKKNGAEDSEEPGISGAEAGEEETEGDTSAELEALREKYLRLSADFDNYKKRLAKEKQEILDFGNAHRLK